MSLKVKFGSAVAALAIVGAVSVAPANAADFSGFKTTIGAAKTCIQGSGSIKTKANCVINTVTSAVSSYTGGSFSLSNIVNTIKSALSGFSLSSLGGLNLSNLSSLLSGLNLSSLRL